jgi:hypothetical protein
VREKVMFDLKIDENGLNDLLIPARPMQDLKAVIASAITALEKREGALLNNSATAVISEDDGKAIVKLLKELSTNVDGRGPEEQKRIAEGIQAFVAALQEQPETLADIFQKHRAIVRQDSKGHPNETLQGCIQRLLNQNQGEDALREVVGTFAAIMNLKGFEIPR